MSGSPALSEQGERLFRGLRHYHHDGSERACRVTRGERPCDCGADRVNAAVRALIAEVERTKAERDEARRIAERYRDEEPTPTEPHLLPWEVDRG